MPACHAAEDNAVQQRVSTETIVAMNATGNFTRCIQAGNCLA
eukprot:CAMPEP_0115630566 /NCGR_PEP_ID=MMETSP0272-20121206/30542_1 /TAXON_ID=71861 /ORGANISM="Scrippsiella trochoidea, Strain CCMP3099" /LENGTH=41 /DNA_ID= /DNA_START= /DNA_END= /DNA_ORIENTATION=